MIAHWSLQQVACLLDAPLRRANSAFHSISIDSRAVEPDALFFAVKGERTDGHLYLNQAFERGAAAAVVRRGHPALQTLDASLAKHLLEVDDVLFALWRTAHWHRMQYDLPVIAITGSSGKTTTKDMVRSVLGAARSVHANPGSFNNEFGLPLTILGLRPDHDALVLEMGMRGLGQIAKLCAIAEPTIGIITNIGVTHLELLGTEENIFEAKTELLGAIPAQGHCLLNSQNKWTPMASSRCGGKCWTFGWQENSDIRASRIREGARSISFDVTAMGQTGRCALPFPGRHNMLDALSAIGVGRLLGLSLETCLSGLEQLDLSAHRLSYRPGIRGATVIDDCYNANPDSMRASLEVLAKSEGRKIAVLGDMLELGTLERFEHQGVGRTAAELGMDMVIGVGELAEWIVRGAAEGGMAEAYAFAENDSAGQWLRSRMKEGDVILLKGSRAMKMEQILTFITEEGQKNVDA